jgi:hypothetical protein
MIEGDDAEGYTRHDVGGEKKVALRDADFRRRKVAPVGAIKWGAPCPPSLSALSIPGEAP